jgi:hypothetical protein
VVDSESDEDFTTHVHAEVNPDGDGGKKHVPKSAKTALIGKIEIPRRKMKFSPETKVTLAEAFIKEHGTGKGVSAKTGRITTKKLGRRHTVSFADMRDHYLAAFHEKLTVEKAVEILNRFADKGIKAEYTKASVKAGVVSLAKRAFDDPQNLRIGDQAVNASLQENVDPPEGLVQKKIDALLATYIAVWGVPGIPWTVSVKDKEPIEWEITEESE